jgi:AcrR family transcriptional regulator
MTSMAEERKRRRPRADRERTVLDAAQRLFYSRGVHEIGMDALIAETGLGKATVYRLYPTKADLIGAYLARLQGQILEAIDGDIAGSDSPMEALARILDAIEADVSRTEFRGCPFHNASVEFDDGAHPARAAARTYRQELADRFVALAGDEKGRQIAIVVDGVYTNAAHLGAGGPAREGLALARSLAASVGRAGE